MPEEIDSSRLRKIVLERKTPVFVLFHGNWCGDCRAFEPTWERWVRDAPGLVFAVHIERGGPEWKEWNIREIPTVAVYSNGAERGRADGVIKEADLLRIWKLV